MKALTRSEAAARLTRIAGLCSLLGDPSRAWVLLELGAGTQDTTTLATAFGCTMTALSARVSALRLAALVETTRAGKHSLHALTPAGRRAAEGIEKLAAD